MKKLFLMIVGAVLCSLLHSCAAANQAAHATDTAAGVARNVWDLRRIIELW